MNAAFLNAKSDMICVYDGCVFSCMKCSEWRYCIDRYVDMIVSTYRMLSTRLLFRWELTGSGRGESSA